MTHPSKPEQCLRVVFLGDVVGRPGRAALREFLMPLRSSSQSDLVIANGENAAGGAGIDLGTAHEIKSAGVDLITLGDHSFQRKGAAELLNEHPSWCIRPANLPADATPGRGEVEITMADGLKVRVINLLGRVFISGTTECPFRAINSWLDGYVASAAAITICDFHAEATSEKYAMARHIDGKVSLLVGTHTHVQTSDVQILPGGTGYITDLGMTGNQHGVIGMRSEVALKRFLSPMPAPYQVAEGAGELKGIIADIDRVSGRTVGIYLV